VNAKGDEIDMIGDLEVLPLNVTENVEVLGWYTNEKGLMVPFAVHSTVWDKEIVFFNIDPLIQKLSESNSTHLANEIIGNIFEFANLDLPEYADENDWIAVDDIFAFKEVFFEGNIEVKSPSIFLQNENSPVEINITTNEGQESSVFANSFSVKGVRDVSILARNLSINRGRGFYTLLNANNSTVVLNGSNATISLKLLNGTVKEISSGSTGEININANHTLYARNPHFHIDGNASFKEAYAWYSTGESFLKTEMKRAPYNDDINITGSIDFDLIVSDTFTITRNFSWEGQVEGPPLIQWNDWSKITETFSLSAWLFAFILCSLYIIIHQRAKNTILKRTIEKLRSEKITFGTLDDPKRGIYDEK
jgi:hypothetical protein